MSVIDGYELDRLYAVDRAAKAWAEARAAAIEHTTPATFSTLANAEAALVAATKET